jgi:MFS family permease
VAVSSRRPTFFYGWAIVAFGVLVVFASAPGQSFVFSVFVDDVRAETGLTRTGISTLYAVGTVASAAMVFLVSRLAARVGPRYALVAAGIGLAVACFAMYGASSTVVLLIVFASLRALGQGSLTINTTVMTAQWFVRKRGRAMALMGLGYPLSIAVLPPIAKLLVDSLGWQEAYAVLGVVVLVAIVPGALLIARDKPEDKGLFPDGSPEPPVQERPEGTIAPARGVAGRLKFWHLALPLAVPSLISTGLIFHQIAVMSERSLSSTFAAQLFIPHAMALAAMAVVAGFLLDRFGPKATFAWGIGLLLGAMFLLSAVESEATAIAYSVLLGSSEGTTRVVNAAAWAHYFGRTNLARLQGSAVMVVVTGTAIGPLPFAVMANWLGELSQAAIVLAALPLAALLLVVVYRPPASIPRRGNAQ